MLYIMRHGRTDWNDRHKLQGRTDVPLNEEGRRMAEKAAEEYRDIPLDVCWCSPLIRARETAEIVLRGRDVPILTDDRLREIGNDWLSERTDSEKADAAMSARKSPEEIVPEIRAYIRTHLADCSREVLSRRFYLSPDYLSRIFLQKKQIFCSDLLSLVSKVYQISMVRSF